MIQLLKIGGSYLEPSCLLNAIKSKNHICGKLIWDPIYDLLRLNIDWTIFLRDLWLFLFQAWINFYLYNLRSSLIDRPEQNCLDVYRCPPIITCHLVLQSAFNSIEGLYDTRGPTHSSFWSLTILLARRLPGLLLYHSSFLLCCNQFWSPSSPSLLPKFASPNPCFFRWLLDMSGSTSSL